MGKTSRTSLGVGNLRTLNQPRAAEVAVDARNIPRAVRLASAALRVVAIGEVWRIDDGWWRDESEQVSRMYFEVILENGAHITLYHDLLRGSWHEQRA